MQVSKGISQKSGTLTTTCVYDALGQLVRVDDPHENATWVYEYDRGGNMTKRKKYAYTTGSLDGLSYSLRSYTYDSTWKDQLVSNGSYPLTYDAMGNLKTYADWEYEWEAGRLLKKQTQNEKVISYDYDQNGMRIRKTESNTSGYVYAVSNYTYNGSKLVHLTKNSDYMHFFYDDQGHVATADYNGTLYNYLYNLQGDVIAIVDSNGAIVVEYKYNAWGSNLSKAGTMANTLGSLNPFRYRGYIYDEQTWMYWVKSRYYYPELYRFINADSIIAIDGAITAHHIYLYSRNTPINLKDSTGNFVDLASGTGFAGGVSFCGGGGGYPIADKEVIEDTRKKTSATAKLAYRSTSVYVGVGVGKGSEVKVFGKRIPGSQGMVKADLIALKWSCEEGVKVGAQIETSYSLATPIYPRYGRDWLAPVVSASSSVFIDYSSLVDEDGFKNPKIEPNVASSKSIELFSFSDYHRGYGASGSISFDLDTFEKELASIWTN